MLTSHDMNRSFSIDWWVWLFLTGASIGAVTRCACFPYSRNKQTDRSQCQNDRSLRHGSSWLVHNRRPLGKVWRYEDVFRKAFVVFFNMQFESNILCSAIKRDIGVPVFCALSSFRFLSSWRRSKSISWSSTILDLETHK